MKFEFSKKELMDLFITALMLALAFSFLFKGISLDVILIFPLMLLVVLFSFIIHEIAHKYFAQKYHYIAEFRANFKFLIVTVLLSLIGYIVAAPGAVYTIGPDNKRKQGIIALAGPASNIFLAALFLILTILTPISYLNSVFSHIYFINAILGLFNMLPAPGFDGHKVWKWNKLIFFSSGLLALALWSVLLLS